MISSLATHFDALESRRRAFLDDLGRESAAALEFRPAPDAWSLAQLTQHLWLVERGTVHVLARSADKPPLRPDALAPLKHVALRLLLASGVRYKAPIEAILPVQEMTFDAVRAEWDTVRGRLHDVLEQTTPEGMQRLVFRHPITGPMTVSQTVDFLVRHHDHHLGQVRRIRRAAGFPKA